MEGEKLKGKFERKMARKIEKKKIENFKKKMDKQNIRIKDRKLDLLL